MYEYKNDKIIDILEQELKGVNVLGTYINKSLNIEKESDLLVSFGK